MPEHILYSFRRCPYAIRARWALKACNLEVELREVDLKDKPEELLNISQTKTVPLLVLRDGRISKPLTFNEIKNSALFDDTSS